MEILKPKLNAHLVKQLTKQGSLHGMQVLVNALDTINLKKLQRLNLNTNKGDFGTVAIIGGNKCMHGALYLAGRASMLCGSGKVVLASLDPDFKTDILMPELMTGNYKNILKHLENYSVIVVGPGLGLDAKAHKLMEKILELQLKIPFVFDADALNLLSKHQDLHFKFRTLPNKIITPHPKEAARLLNIELEEVEKDRVAAIKKLSEYYNATTLLKGHASLMFDGNELIINPTGNPGLSNAGQGDTLCGIISSLIAQGLDLFSSLRLAVYSHGLAADQLAKDKYQSYIGITASEVALEGRLLLIRF